MTVLRAHRKFSPGDDPWIPVELIEVTSPPKAHKGRALQHEWKVIKVEKVKEIRNPNQEVLGHETSTWAGGLFQRWELPDSPSSTILANEHQPSRPQYFQPWIEHPVASLSKEMIPAEIWYETHDQERLIIIEAFKPWRHYLEGCKYEALVLTNHKNFRWVIPRKSLSSRQATQKQLATLPRCTKCPFPPSVMPVLEQAPRQVRAESRSSY